MKYSDIFDRLAKVADGVLYDHLKRTQNKTVAEAYKQILDPFFDGFKVGWAKAEQEGSATYNSILGTSFDDNAKLDVSLEPEKFAEALAAFLCALLTTPLHAIISGNGVARYKRFAETLRAHNPEFCRLKAGESAVFEKFIKDMEKIANSA